LKYFRHIEKVVTASIAMSGLSEWFDGLYSMREIKPGMRPRIATVEAFRCFTALVRDGGLCETKWRRQRQRHDNWM